MVGIRKIGNSGNEGGFNSFRIDRSSKKKGESLSNQEISRLVKQYRQKEPEQFLAMYDSIRDKSSSE